MKCINESPASSEDQEESQKSRYDLWLDKSYINPLRPKNHSFPVYCINDISKSLVKLGKNQISRPTKVVDQVKSFGNQSIDSNLTGGRLETIFSSNWFKEFIYEKLSKGYPLSRFTILVSIWIIAVDCNHKILEQLISELIDQIYHEEANSNNEEELLQLTQVGSFWVTYHKKYEATIRQLNLSQAYDNGNDDDDDDDGERSSFDDDVIGVDLSSSSSSSSNSSVSLFDSSSLIERKRNVDDDNIINETGGCEEDIATKSMVDLRSKLRRLIDDEFLHGVKCIICSYEPSELFEPLNTSFCPKCFNLKPVERCSISYRPLELVCLKSLMNFKPNISKLILVSPNEWARYLIAPKLATLRIDSKLAKSKAVVATAIASASASANYDYDDQTVGNKRQQQQQRQQQIGENVVVAENYERLTVIRGDINQVRQKVGSKDDGDDEEVESSTSSTTTSSPTSSRSSSPSSLLQKDDSLSYGDKNKFSRRERRRQRRKKKMTGDNQRMDDDTYISILENHMKVRFKRKFSQDKTSIRGIGHTNSSSLSETIELFKMISVAKVGATNKCQDTLLPLCLTDLLIMDTSHDGRMLKIALVTSSNKLFESGSLWSCLNRSSISKLRLGCGSVFTSLELTRLGSQSLANNEFSCPHCECQPLIRLGKLNEQL